VVQNVVLYLLSCAAVFGAYFVYKTSDQNQNAKYKKLLHEFGKAWITEKHVVAESSSDDAQPPVKEPTPWRPNRIFRADYEGISTK
jgi:hypothetical protein